MAYYIFIFTTLFIAATSSFFLNKEKSKFIYITFVILMSLFASLRYETGYDWSYYESMFEKSNWAYIWGNLNVEPFYVLYSMLIKELGGSFFALTFSFSIVAFSLKAIFIYKKSLFPVVSLFLFLPLFFRYDMGMMRQGVAIAILIWASQFVQNKKPLNFFALVVLSSLFHFSSLLFIPVYFISNRKFSILIILMVLISALIIDILIRTDILPYLFSFTFEHVQFKFNAYFNPNNPLSIQIQSLYWRFFIYGLGTYVVFVKNDSELRYYMNIYLIGILYFIVFASVSTLSERGSLYFKIFEILIIPKIISFILEKYKMRIAMLVFLIFSFYTFRHFYFQMSESYKNYYVPYKTVFYN